MTKAYISIEQSSNPALTESGYEQSTRLFSPENSKSLEKNKSKSLISTAYLTNIRLRCRFQRDAHSSPSWRK